MNTPDIILLLLVLIPGVITGARKGFIYQVVTIAAILLGARLSSMFATVVAEWLKHYLTTPDNILYALAFAGIFISVYLVLYLSGQLILKAVESLLGGWVDKLLGILFGVCKYALLAGLLLIVVNTLNAKFGLIRQECINSSKVSGALVDLANFVFPYLKAFIGK